MGKTGGTASPARPCVMVIFGASGDLTRRKLMPALYNLDVDGLLLGEFKVVGFARTRMSDGQFRESMRKALAGKSEARSFSRAKWQRFAKRLHYVTGGYDDADSYAKLTKFVCAEHGRAKATYGLYYLALPPTVAETVLGAMKKSGLLAAHDGATSRVMLEKPFGYDLESSRRLNAILAGTFDESQVYRVDHYLGKDAIRNLLVFRFANSVFEPVWNRRYVDNIQITAAEEIGIEGRGGYYDRAGVVRDTLQNHVMQVLALVMMEAPLAGDAESVRDRKFEVFKSLAPIAQGDFVFGQYLGYRSERNVGAKSQTPTFAALKMGVNNWRWFGIPVYVRAGKALKAKLTEVAIQFREIPLCVLSDEEACGRTRPNVLYIRIQPDEGIRLSISVKVPGRGEAVEQAGLDFRYSQFGLELPNAYERLLLDCLAGVPTLFWRADSVELAWRAVAPLIAAEGGKPAAKVQRYEPGGWGPAAAHKLLAADGRSWLSTG